MPHSAPSQIIWIGSWTICASSNVHTRLCQVFRSVFAESALKQPAEERSSKRAKNTYPDKKIRQQALPSWCWRFKRVWAPYDPPEVTLEGFFWVSLTQIVFDEVIFKSLPTRRNRSPNENRVQVSAANRQEPQIKRKINAATKSWLHILEEFRLIESLDNPWKTPWQGKCLWWPWQGSYDRFQGHLSSCDTHQPQQEASWACFGIK